MQKSKFNSPLIACILAQVLLEVSMRFMALHLYQVTHVDTCMHIVVGIQVIVGIKL